MVDDGTNMKLIVGLGNPGKEYAGTRHNIGFEVVGALAKELEADFKSEKSMKAEIAETRRGSEKILLAKPTTFMNLSGDAVRSIVSFYKIPLEDVLIIQDEMDLPLGQLKLVQTAGTAGHNGVADIQTKLGTKSIPRLRLGIGRDTDLPKDEFVLSFFDAIEKPDVKTLIARGKDAALSWLDVGIDKAMGTWNVVKGDA